MGVLAGHQPRAPKKVALLVGINHYDKRGFDHLRFAERDVEALKKELERGKQFTVVVLQGSAEGDLRATRENIDKQLQALLKDVGKEDLVLVAFSGHGQQLKVKRDGKEQEEPFVCPVDAVSGEPESQFSLSYLIDDVLARKGGKNLVLVDACRSAFKDPGRRAKGVQGRRITTPEDTAVLFSCRAGQQSFEHEEAGGGHGLFTYCVLQTLRKKARDGKVTWTGLLDEVVEQMSSEEVAQWRPRGAAQEPIEAGGLGRTVLLAVEGASRPPRDDDTVRRAPPKRAQSPFDAEEAKALQKAWAKYLGCKVVEEVDLGGDVTLAMVLIPPGTFLMGAPEGEEEGTADEKPPHKVGITRPFFLGKYEATQEEYQRLMKENPSGFSAEGEGKEDVAGENTQRFPVECISWDDAQKFLEKLDDRHGESMPAQLRRDGYHFRLPTEAQWEYACRAGTTTAFHFGRSLNGEEANCNGDSPYKSEKGPSKGRTTKVGSYAPNAFGLYDMHGNVLEWCQDGWDEKFYAKEVIADPINLKTDPEMRRVSRGGSWVEDARRCRAAFRNREEPGVRGNIFGFRICFRLD
jgi:formylglycine-generating enzyme required for sulfatase activity